jgi:hypothetical protein
MRAILFALYDLGFVIAFAMVYETLDKKRDDPIAGAFLCIIVALTWPVSVILYCVSYVRAWLENGKQ